MSINPDCRLPAYHWDSPWTTPLPPPPTGNYEKLCKIAAIVGAIAAMVLLTVSIAAFFTSGLAFLAIPMLVVIGVALLIYMAATAKEGRNPPSNSTNWPAYRGYELRPTA